LLAYETKQNRKKLVNGFTDKAKVVSIIQAQENFDVAYITNVNRALVVNTSQIPEKTTKNSIGVQVQTLKKNQFIKSAEPVEKIQLENSGKYKTKNIPAAGSFLRDEDIAQQLALI
ncbi:MAG: topoisomerase IV, partial [Oscillospiraceae bacterium]